VLPARDSIEPRTGQRGRAEGRPASVVAESAGAIGRAGRRRAGSATTSTGRAGGSSKSYAHHAHTIQSRPTRSPQLGQIRKRLRPPRTLALTATATPEVRDDVVKVLKDNPGFVSYLRAREK